MASPIKMGLTLVGKDAEAFIDEMLRPTTTEEKENFKSIKKRFEGKDHLFNFY
ncbi:hypothetical protein [Methanobrevibacter filiformis]|uniref:Uncharacterized protein n=1 Tax=Methanobrevibacter filiformis TaxID=55758 RepID=A0A166EVK0_9EURY|nr:hypothetical protein [Methanobrevibacter filiformis]KZX17062.1 hypothetical protein MBFIL_03800 [Methanobrevibacter filiformis]